MKKIFTGQNGFSVIEVILASALFIIFSTAIISVVLQGFDTSRTGSEETIASQYASEGIEAIRSIKNQGFNNLVATTSAGLVRSGSNVWAFSGLSNTFGKYTRVASIAAVQRDSNGNIVASGGTVDPNIVKVTSTVSWNVSPTRNDSVILSTYMTNFKSGRSGMLVYGDGGTTTDAIKYRIFDANTNTWTATASAADVDTTATNKALRAVKLYASSTRNEKVMISRHYDGTNQTIYAQVYNGTNAAWGNVIPLATISAALYLHVQNFDGTYLSNGQFMAVYSDNTVIPKSRIWDGTTWQSQTSLTTLGASQIPNYITVAARPGTNEVMAAFLTQGTASTSANTITQYYSGSSWFGITSHSTAAPTNAKRLMNFVWSPNTTTTGAIVFATSSATTSITGKVFVANGSGGGSWGGAATGSAQANTLGAMSLIASPSANEFHVCDKDAAATPTIVCRKITFSGNVTTFVTPTNPIIAAATDTGIQESSALGFDSVSGSPGMAVYSDNTAIPKLKKYTGGTATWDAAATTISTTGYTPGIIKSVRVVPQTQSNDMIALMGDANLALYSVFWDGTNNNMYTSPVAKAAMSQGVNGSATTDYWYDFSWDQY